MILYPSSSHQQICWRVAGGNELLANMQDKSLFTLTPPKRRRVCLAIDKFGEQIRITHQQTTEDKNNFTAVLKGSNGCVSLELQMCITSAQGRRCKS